MARCIRPQAMLGRRFPARSHPMRHLLALPALALLAACASPLPPHDPQQAWVTLRSAPGELLMAEKLDGRRLNDGRYFQLAPGIHRLEASYRFEVYLGSTFAREPLQRLCYLRLDYPGFIAGARYVLRAEHRALQTRSWLEDAHGQRLATGREWQCLNQ